MLWFPSTRYTWRTQTLICPDTPQKTCQEHDTPWHVTFPDTSRSDPGFAECRGISRSRKFHEIAHFTQWFLSSGLKADKFSCTTGTQFRRYVKIKIHFDQFNGHGLPYFPNQISPLVGTSPKIDWALNKIIICVRMMQIIHLAWVCILELLRNCIIFELVTLHSEGIFTWVHDTYSSKVIISTKFSNTCKQLSITLGNLIALNILPLKLCPPHLKRK